jgi:hypothetical protein
MSDYRFSEEYLDRFGLNGSDIYWLERAVNFYKEEAKAELEQTIAEGGQPVLTPRYMDMLYEDILVKLEMWVKPEKVYEEDELPL